MAIKVKRTWLKCASCYLNIRKNSHLISELNAYYIHREFGNVYSIGSKKYMLKCKKGAVIFKHYISKSDIKFHFGSFKMLSVNQHSSYSYHKSYTFKSQYHELLKHQTFTDSSVLLPGPYVALQ